MDKEHLSSLCLSINESFKQLVDFLNEEMKAQAFTTSDYDTLRIEYAFLNKLSQRIHNEAGEAE